MAQLLNRLADVKAVIRARIAFRRATMGPRTRLYGRAFVRDHGRIVLGDRVRFIADVAPIEVVTGPHGVFEVGEGSFINYGSSFGAQLAVRLGPRCNIGSYCILLDNDFHRIEPERRDELPESAPITLGQNVWLGSRVIVLPGVTIGDDSVIGAGSVVTRDVPARSLAVGVPARVVRTL